ncbi:MAG: 3'(2'),5'-bisphosphate nucleotidase CysQ [Bacteroidetes bacterium]|nr:3'(2'),5'-bisphosphate nucleotidase CysQ [Bacteroidota bacterium]
MSEFRQALEAALAAGRKILNVYENEFKVELKEDKSPLTEADEQAHQVIIKYLSDTGIPVLSEESSRDCYENRSEWKRFWMVDPLDGTKEFIKRNGEFTVNIALIENGAPVWGVVYAPVLKKLYWGGDAGMSYKAEKVHPESGWEEIDASKVKISAQPLGEPYTVVGSRSHLSGETESFIQELRIKHGEIEWISIGSSLKICMVAEGTAQIYPRFAPTMEWDTAAGHAIAKASGCRVFNPETGIELTYNKENLLNPWFIVKAGNDDR